eukprot:CAMPEP_0194205832 /NCGR_PEP_ID=MMETSP0156-20130528/5030_1 /TAXON_ID=33649 /ORGANISM="Thalassionema nitzschioides, Strain L26-B" /LENGTH=128 /DNA_ID=CAMNT_0038932215 /DNA_START=84 /DNA_END=467 /DNA_ORIENTATION=+
MKFIAVILAVFLASATGNNIKQRLQEDRDPTRAKANIVVTEKNNRHEKRIAKLTELLEERKEQLADHASGHRKLSTEDHSRVLRQRSNFEKKLKQIQSMTKQERAEMMKNEAEAADRMNSLDYLDFEW